jgi:hypothetical protein
MPSSKNTLLKHWEMILMIALFSMTILLGIFFVASKPILEDARRQQVISSLQPTIRRWQSLNYSSIKDSNLKEGIEQIQIQNLNDLNDKQKQQLKDTLYNYIMAYHIATYDAFHRFRAPIDDFSLAGSIVDFMKQDLGKANQPIPSDQEGLFKLYWEKYANANNELSNTWAGIAFTNSTAEVHISTDIMPPLSDYVKTKTNSGVAESSPMINFNVTPETELKQFNKIYYVTILLMADNHDVPYPVYSRFFWAEEYGKWLPLAQVASYSGPKKVFLRF